ncbi:MAG: sugar phosphate isomerase/epimerase [Planctomycetota bacterium]|nr:MAG: sugar phosphate isomerase/epimerase [Planctomycetota bacterium]
MSLRFAYNTNGMQSHRLDDALAILSECGYQGVALTLDHMHLDPLRAGAVEVRRVRSLLRTHRLACAVETGARYLLDPRRKHWPSLCAKDPLERVRRVDFLRRALDIAAELEAEVLNLASGPAEVGLAEERADLLLRGGLEEVLDHAREVGVPVALEPEPGHRVDRLSRYEALAADFPELLLTLDVAHVSVTTAEGSAAEAIERFAPRLALVHLEDAPRGVHAHLPFGEGDLPLEDILDALARVEFSGLCAVELSRHSHRAHELPARSLEALRAALPGVPRPSA